MFLELVKERQIMLNAVKPHRSKGSLTLIGSGELSPSMGKVHRAVMSRITKPKRTVFLDTPAGFELNADEISAKAVNFFEKRLQNDLVIASFKSAALATSAEVESTVKRLQVANYIFAGPGSPTYAICNWRDTRVFETVARRLAGGAHLVFASAAAIAIGRSALPVYEIYKVGDAPHWVEGLDLLGPYGLDLAIVPHWNSADGGAHDTRYCFIGESRLKQMEQRLPDSTIILGIDEYTACTLDLGGCHAQVMGAGRVTIRHMGCEIPYPAGTTFELKQLSRLDPSKPKSSTSGLQALPQATVEMDDVFSEPPLNWELSSDLQDHDMMRSAPFIDLLVTVRARLRANRQWALADEIRQQLSMLGIIVEDGPSETTWRKE